MTEGIAVRPARAGDLEAVAAILVAGFHSQFEAAFRERMDRAIPVLTRTLAKSPRGLLGLYVAEVGERVVGTTTLRRREDPEDPAWPAMAIFFEELGVWGGLRAMFYLSLLDQSFSRRDAYVSDVAVAPDCRRRGVGQALLDHVEKVARFWGKRALVLDVGAENEIARRLYRRLGYAETGVHRSLVARWLLGTGKWVRMRKEL